MVNKVYSFDDPGYSNGADQHFTVTINKMEPGSIMVALDDITESVAREKQMQQTLLDKAVEQGKFEIASGMLHDIGNAVVGFGSYLNRIRQIQQNRDITNLENLAGFLKNQLPELTSAMGKEKSQAVISLLNGTVQSLKQTNQQMNSYVTDQFNIITHIQEILSIQRQYTAVQHSQQRAPVNLRSVINDSLAMLFATMDKKRITVSLDISQKETLIKADRTKLMQVLLNLLKNSIDSFETDIKERKIHIRLCSVNGSLTIEIRDNGSGFDVQTGERLFERGFTTKRSGSGLGLANCKSIIDSHSGLISITSPGPGQGTTAIIKFKI
ncbi:hypothetical protein Dfri01_64590 [Dyadobacter frigoris]|uniref:sensor histidine kinase n=1 Tax=Dyadobacter frigoris TaxID=2576211 RepID=UPI0024A3BC99|nr:HAMP domain-containing sensor histidine kinase [Dyadobacter frigoris]GLU56998.1 hypothetical protein Dfri01_64590 [Dyadobacter frigoris]